MRGGSASRQRNAAIDSAELLRGGMFDGLNRPRDAERAYRAALGLVDRQRRAPSVGSRVAVHKRLAAILTARGDRPGALREYAEVLKLVPADGEALAVKGGS